MICPYCRHHNNFLAELRHNIFCSYCGYIKNEYPEWIIMKGFRRLFWEKGFYR